jgi:hypothetical protein
MRTHTDIMSDKELHFPIEMQFNPAKLYTGKMCVYNVCPARANGDDLMRGGALPFYRDTLSLYTLLPPA